MKSYIIILLSIFLFFSCTKKKASQTVECDCKNITAENYSATAQCVDNSKCNLKSEKIFNGKEYRVSVYHDLNIGTIYDTLSNKFIVKTFSKLANKIVLTLPNYYTKSGWITDTFSLNNGAVNVQSKKTRCFISYNDDSLIVRGNFPYVTIYNNTTGNVWNQFDLTFTFIGK